MIDLNTHGQDVWKNMWMVVQALGPIYAIIFGIAGVGALLDNLKTAFKKKYFSPPKKTSKRSNAPRSSRPRRSSVFVAADKNPRIRKTKSGVFIYYD